MQQQRNPRRWLILVVLCLSTLVLVVDNMVLTVAVPPLTEELGASAQDAQWILESYMLVFAGLLLTAGSLSDRFGRRRVMVIGLGLFGLASLAATFAGSPGELIAARTVMGIGGALIMPSTLSILITVFDDEERRKAMSAWSAVAMVGLIGGPVLGGVLIAHFWWGSVFLINVPIAAVAIVAALVLMPESKGPAQKADPIGGVLSAVGMVALVWMINELPKGGLDHPGTLIALLVAVLGLGGFIAWELHTPHPMVPMKLFRNRDFSGGSFAMTLVQVGNGGLMLVLTQYLQFVLGYSAMDTGLAFIPMAVSSLLFNALGAAGAQRLGNRMTAVGGLLVMAVGFTLLSTVDAESGFAEVAVALAVLGAGGGLAMPAAISALMATVPAEQAGIGSALNDTIQQAGAALGVAFLGSVLSAGYSAAMPASAPEKAQTSIADALTVAGQTDDNGLIASARDAFTHGMSASFLFGAGGVLVASVVALVVMRGRKAVAAEAAGAESAKEPVLVETAA
jgi:EmrB/QacA subfamily drug resistance transporter